MINRLYRGLLYLLPKSFRAQFGAEMLQAFLLQRTRPGARAERAARIWRALTDVAITALHEHGEGARHHVRARLERSQRAMQAASQSPQPHHHQTGGAVKSVTRDFRFAMRSLRKQPAFSLTVIATLALGIGANTAVFSLIDGVLLRPVAVTRPGELLAIYEALNDRSPNGDAAFPTFEALSSGTRTLQGIAGWRMQDVGMRSGSRVEQVSSVAVSGNYFALLGVPAIAGRNLVDSDDRQEALHVATIGETTARRFFPSNAAAVGSVIHLGGTPFTIVGVVPSSFHGLRVGRAPDIWVPIRKITQIPAGGIFSGKSAASVFVTPYFNWVGMVGRLREGVAPETAAAELNVLFKRIGEKSPKRSRLTLPNPISVVPVNTAAAMRDRDDLLRFVRVLVGVVVLTLLIACLNVANLLLVRGGQRAREMSIRAAIGATRWHLLRQLSLENLLLGLMGAAVGIAVAVGTVQVFSAFTLPGDLSLSELRIAPDARVLAFTAFAALVTTSLFGILPAIRASRANGAWLTRSHGTSQKQGPRSLLVAAQVALSMSLVVGAALFLRSLEAGLNTNVGFDPQPLAAATVEPRLHGYDAERASVMYDDVLKKLAAVPGVQHAAVAIHIPLAPMTSLPFSRDDGVLPDGKESVVAGMNAISADYFKVLGVPVAQGRAFTDGDGAGQLKVAIVNETAVKHFWGTGSPLGRTVTLFGSIRYTIVGVVRDTKYESIGAEDTPVVFVPLSQEPALGATSIVVRTTRPEQAARALAEQIKAVDPLLPVRDVRLVADQMDVVLMPQRFGSLLLVAFGLVAIAVSAVGIYGVIAYAANQRSQEIGVRLALGARGRDIVRLVALRSGLAIGGGLVAGLGLSLLSAQALDRFLFRVTAADPTAIASALAVLLATALAAAWLPARRAVQTNPAITIREG